MSEKLYWNVSRTVVEIIEADSLREAGKDLETRLAKAGFDVDEMGVDGFECDENGWEITR